MQRRRRAPRGYIAEGEFRNVTFRVGALAYNALAKAAETSSISEVCERVILAGLPDTAPIMRFSDDLRTLIREEVRAALAEQRMPASGAHPMLPAECLWHA